MYPNYDEQGIDVKPSITTAATAELRSRRRVSTHSSVDGGVSSCCLSRDKQSDGSSLLEQSRGAPYRQCVVQVVSEDEVVSTENIADVACRIVEVEKVRLFFFDL